MSDTELPLRLPTDIALELRTLADRVPSPSLGAARRSVRRRLSRLSWRRRTRNVVGNGALVATVITGGTRLAGFGGSESAGVAEAAPAPDIPAAEPPPPAPAPPPVSSGTGSIAPLLADPAALWDRDVAHLYATTGSYCADGADDGDCETRWVPRFTSSTLQSPAQLQGDAMPERPAWVAAEDRVIWAPSVTRVGDRYVLYFAATAGSGRYRQLKCIGAAVASNPAGPFVPQATPLTCRDRFWSIDPYVVADDGELFLLWRQDAPGHTTGRIVAARLRADGLALAGDAPPQVLLTGSAAWEDGYPRDARDIGPIENPALARHPVTGEWLLTWSANRWETANYATGLATCDGPLGPCERVSDDAPWLRTSDDASVESDAEFVGAGGLSFFTGPDGGLYAVLHAYRSDAADGAAGDPRAGWVFAVDSADADDTYTLREIA